MVFAPADVDQLVRRCTPEEAAAVPRLRFKKGDRVLCNMGAAGFKRGVIVQCWVKRHPPPDAPPGSQPLVVPYQIKLVDDGTLVFAPNDRLDTIREDQDGNHDGNLDR